MKKEDKLFFWGIFTVTLSFFLVPLALYLFPAAWFGWEYTVPQFIINLTLWIQVTFHITYRWAFLKVMRLIFLVGFLFGIIAYAIAHRLGKMKIEAEEHINMSAEEKAEAYKKAEQKRKETSDSLILLLKIAAIASLVFFFANIMHIIISV